MSGLVLSLFPGIGLLDMAFEQEGFCVVRGPDVLWGGDIRRFHPPAGKFDGIIGGPPCQCFSRLKYLNPMAGAKTVNLIPEFSRCVEEARPAWFVMENVREANHPLIPGYEISFVDVCDNDVGGFTKRRRRFWFSGLGLRLSSHPEWLFPERAVTRNVRVPEARHYENAKRRGGGVLPGDGRYATIDEVCRLQGLNGSFPKNGPIKTEALRLMLGNGVPLAMGRAIAKAVKEAMNAT